ncbi:MAG: hypothetical protein ABL901_08270 [Hyphomicrobiaceae bacterium]
MSDIREAISGSGGTKHAEALDRIQAALADLDHAPASDAIARIDTNAAGLTQPAWEAKLAQLQSAGLNEPEFLRLLDEIANDKNIKKADLLKIAQVYVGYADKKASTDKLISAIKTRFYGKIYDRDADEMAKRATPW